MEMNKGIKCGLVGLGVGLAIGTAAGILAAPKSGKESRVYIVEQAKKATTKAKSSVSRKGSDKTKKSTKK